MWYIEREALVAWMFSVLLLFVSTDGVWLSVWGVFWCRSCFTVLKYSHCYHLSMRPISRWLLLCNVLCSYSMGTSILLSPFNRRHTHLQQTQTHNLYGDACFFLLFVSYFIFIMKAAKLRSHISQRPSELAVSAKWAGCQMFGHNARLNLPTMRAHTS